MDGRLESEYCYSNDDNLRRKTRQNGDEKYKEDKVKDGLFLFLVVRREREKKFVICNLPNDTN